MAMTNAAMLEEQLLDNWQRDFPLVRRPFADMAKVLGFREEDVLAGLQALRERGVISRVGGVVKPNTLGASTLAAMAVPNLQAGYVAEQLTMEPGINHIYLRESDWNLWFVVTGPNREYIDSVLTRIAHVTGFRVLDLRLERPFHIDLGFSLNRDHMRPVRHEILKEAGPLNYELMPGDRELVQVLTDGLALVPRPFQAVAAQLARSEDDVIGRLRTLTSMGVVPRMGVIVRHRALGWRSNAMVVWDVPEHDVERAGLALAATPGINLCYRRTRYEGSWPYNLYCMVHAKARDDALRILQSATAAATLSELPRKILFSLRCFKQTGALLSLPKEAA